MKISSHNFTNQTARRGAERVLLAVFCVFFALLIAVGAGASTFLPAMAAEYTAYDRTAIEDDLRGVDISAYPADENGRHFLLDDVGFMEYGYSESAFIVDNYFGIYLYVYNPTEREVSTRAGANVVNMATEYDAEGEPTNYENVPITVLDHTENYRFYKFRITDSSAIYTRANLYARAHDGVRRYDIAGIQLWFLGDQNATDSFTERNEKSVTYRCTGYAAGCDEDGSEESTLKIQRDKLESVTLDVQHTFYRSATSDKGVDYQNQVDSVFFTVPQHLFDEYGTLQRIKAEWWEFQTKEIVVISNEEYYNKILPYVGVAAGKPDNYKDDVGFSLTYNYSFLPSTGAHSFDGGWNLFVDVNGVYGQHGVDFDAQIWEPNGRNLFEKIYLLFPTKAWGEIGDYDPYADIETQGGVSVNRLESYIFQYDKTYDSGTVSVKDGKLLSADLFQPDIQEDRKMNGEQGVIQSGFDGKSYYDFDAEADIDKIISYEEGGDTWWDRWTQYGWSEAFQTIEAEEGRTIEPIKIIGDDDLAGEEADVAERLMIQSSDVQALRDTYEDAITVEDAGDEPMAVVMFRFAVSDYFSAPLEVVHGGPSVTHDVAYAARQTVFLNFDIIQLTFNDSGEMTVIPVVSDPIDIIDPITPPVDFGSNYWTLVWWLVGMMVGSVVVGIIGTMAQKMSDKNR